MGKCLLFRPTNQTSSMAQKKNAPKATKRQAQDQDDDGSAPNGDAVTVQRKRAPTARSNTLQKKRPKKIAKVQHDPDPDDTIDLSSVASDSTTDEDERKPVKSVKDVEKMVKRVRKGIARHERWCPFIHRSRQLRSLNRRVRDLEDFKAALGEAVEVDDDDELNNSAKAKKPQKTNTKQPRAAPKKPRASHQEEDSPVEESIESAEETQKADQGDQEQQRVEDVESAAENAAVDAPEGLGSDDNVSSPPEETNAGLEAAYTADAEQTGGVKLARTSAIQKAGGDRMRKPQNFETSAGAKSQEGKKVKKTR